MDVVFLLQQIFSSLISKRITLTRISHLGGRTRKKAEKHGRFDGKRQPEDGKCRGIVNHILTVSMFLLLDAS